MVGKKEEGRSILIISLKTLYTLSPSLFDHFLRRASRFLSWEIFLNLECCIRFRSSREFNSIFFIVITSFEIVPFRWNNSLQFVVINLIKVRIVYR